MDEQERRFYDYFDIDESMKKISNAEIEKNYCLEQEYMEAIRKGDLEETLRLKNHMDKRISKMRPRELALDELKCAYAVNRALSRIAAYEAGIPAPIIHRITTRESSSIGQAHSRKQMEDACVQMLGEFCEIIRQINDNHYSAMVQSIIYTLGQHYIEDVKISELAMTYDITESYMISQFKKETGVTPAMYLRKIRLEEAAKLLVTTDEEIQVVSGKVGIHDANYFVKVFKAKYEMTPKEYRKKHRI